MGHEPSDTRDLLRDQEKPLIKAAKDLARAVEALEDADPDHLYGQAPRALIVGGYVRDLHLGLRPKDADIEVCGVAPDRLKELLERLFGKTKDVGESFGVIKVPIADGLELDVSIPRKESKAGKGHTGFLIDSDPSLNITEAARRRDFTVNAMAMDPITQVVFDPFGGLDDMRERKLRVTDAERFQDDALRVLRAMQFLARLEFTVDPDSERLMREMVAGEEFAELSRERITEEFEKLLFKAKKPSVGLRFARENRIVEVVFPNAKVEDWDEWSRRLDATTTTGKDRHATLAAFFSGFTKGTRDAVIASLSFSGKKDIPHAKSLLRASAYEETAPTNPANDARRTLKRIQPATPESYEAWLSILGREGEGREFLTLVRENGLNAQGLLQGRDLIELFQLKPGPKFKEVLDAVEAARDRAEIETREQAIELAKTLL